MRVNVKKKEERDLENGRKKKEEKKEGKREVRASAQWRIKGIVSREIK